MILAFFMLNIRSILILEVVELVLARLLRRFRCQFQFFRTGCFNSFAVSTTHSQAILDSLCFSFDIVRSSRRLYRLQLSSHYTSWQKRGNLESLLQCYFKTLQVGDCEHIKRIWVPKFDKIWCFTFPSMRYCFIRSFALSWLFQGNAEFISVALLQAYPKNISKEAHRVRYISQ